MNALWFTGSIIGAYLIGAIPFALLIARACGVRDIREHGSGNVGATNVWRVVGPGAAVWVYVLDIGKGVAVVLLARQIDQQLLTRDLFLVCCAGAAILGHVFPVYLKFRGGKGVNTALGTMATLMPIEALISVAVFGVVVALTRYISAGSILGAVALPVTIAIERWGLNMSVSQTFFYTGVALALVVTITHRSNIRRILTGSESKFSPGSKQKRRDTP